MVISDEVLEVARLDPQGRAQSGGCLAYVHARGRLPFDVVCFTHSSVLRSARKPCWSFTGSRCLGLTI